MSICRNFHFTFPSSKRNHEVVFNNLECYLDLKCLILPKWSNKKYKQFQSYHQTCIMSKE